MRLILNTYLSALITHNSNSSTVKVLESLFLQRFIPLYNEDIIIEYEDVLHRRKAYRRPNSFGD